VCFVCPRQKVEGQGVWLSTYLVVTRTSQHRQDDGERVFWVDEGDVEDWTGVY